MLNYRLYRPEFVSKDNQFLIPDYMTNFCENNFISIIVIHENEVMQLQPQDLILKRTTCSNNTYKKRHIKGLFSYDYYKFVPNVDLKNAFNSSIEFAFVNKVHYQWFNFLKSRVFTKSYFVELGKYVSNLNNNEIIPSKQSIFNCLLNDISEIHTVFLTNEPVKDFVVHPLFDEKFLDDSKSVVKRKLFLNCAFAASKLKKNVYLNDWELFIIDLFEILNLFFKQETNFVFIGEKPKAFIAYVNPILHNIFEVEHPSKSVKEERKWNNKSILHL